MRRSTATALLIALPLGVFAQQQVASVYKWKDARGVVHFDDESLLEPRLTQDILDGRKVAPVEAYRVPKEFRASVTQQCQLTRERVTNYRGASALFGRDPLGSVYRLSANQVALTIAGLERDASHLCSQGAAERLYAGYLAKPAKPKDDPKAASIQD